MKNQIPETVKELFENKSQTYYIVNHGPINTTSNSMRLFIEYVEGVEKSIELDDGSQLVLSHPEFKYKIQVDASGDGDFCNSKFQCKVIEG